MKYIFWPAITSEIPPNKTFLSKTDVGFVNNILEEVKLTNLYFHYSIHLSFITLDLNTKCSKQQVNLLLCLSQLMLISFLKIVPI